MDSADRDWNPKIGKAYPTHPRVFWGKSAEVIDGKGVGSVPGGPKSAEGLGNKGVELLMDAKECGSRSKQIG
jgi:hypothetical protein